MEGWNNQTGGSPNGEPPVEVMLSLQKVFSAKDIYRKRTLL